MYKLLFFITCSILFASPTFAQVVKSGERFTEVSLTNDKVVFIKEIAIKNKKSIEANSKILKEWTRINYGKDPFISSVRYDTNKNEFIAKSRIELLLPPNAKGVREKMIMRYRVDGFLYEDKCVLEISEIGYSYDGSDDMAKWLPKVTKANEFITDRAIEVKDMVQELRINTRKSTLFFLNELTSDLEKQFAN